MVEEKEGKSEPVGARVTKDALETSKDTIFPLQNALGYDISQTLFVGPQNLVVEGISDYFYLDKISIFLDEEGRNSLDLSSVTITPVSSASKIPTFVSLLGQHLDVVVLVDSDNQTTQLMNSLITKGLLQTNNLIYIGEITGDNKSDIEDMFEPEEYLKIYNEAFDRSVQPDDLSGKGPIVDQIAEYRAQFDHGRPAEVLLRNPQPYLENLSESTLDRFEELFSTINEALPEG